MFQYADADQDGRINWEEFQTMINPSKIEGQKQDKPVTGKIVTIHPKTLSVTSILKQSNKVWK